MRWLLVLSLVSGCKKEQAGQAPASASGSSAPAGSGVTAAPASDARLATAPAADGGIHVPQADVDLLHALKVHAAVSSVVANPKMSPYDLFDDTMSTAWNSRTGDLAGAWVAFRMPPSAHVKEVRLTVGFTAKGKEGDYFTMNQRIQKVAVWHDGVRLREVGLDVSSRELQVVPVDANGGDYKIEVVAAVPGSKKSWREICISELQVIGQPPPGEKVGRYHWTPELSIGSLDGAVIVSDDFELSEEQGFDSIDDFCKDFIAHSEPDTKNECGGAPAKALAIPALPAGWKGQWLRTKHGGAQYDTCNFVIEAKGSFYVFEDRGVDDCSKGVELTDQSTRQEIRVGEMMGDGGEPELALLTTKAGDAYGTSIMNDMGQFEASSGLEEVFTLCAAGATGIPHCADVTAGSISKGYETGNGPGADGYAEYYTYDTKRDISVDNGLLVIKNVKGSYDDYDVRTKAGRHRVHIIE